MPSIQVEPSDAQIAAMYLGFTSDVLQDNQVTDYLIRVVQPRLSAIAGVQRAEILGARTFALRAWLKPDRMAALNVTPSQLRRALAANNFLTATGTTKGALTQLNITTSTDLRSLDGFKKLVIREQNGALVRLEDVATVELGADEYDQDVRFSGEKAVFMGVWVLPSASALDVIGRVNDEIKNIAAELPTGMQVKIAYDSTSYIQDAMQEVVKTLSETILIVMVVIFLFLGSLRSALVPVVAIPVSLIGGVFLMQAFGFTLNLLTLLAIVLSVGLVVDDAIVVVENVERHIREGRTPYRAALLGARELIGPVIAMTITLAAVYVPIGIQGGLTGALFREFAFTLAGAVFISGVVALTLSPVMSSRLLRSEHQHGWFARKVEGAFDAVRNRYTKMLDGTLRFRPAVYAVWITLAVLLVPMYMFSPGELAPHEDQSFIFGAIDVPANATLEQVTTYSAEVGKIFAEHARIRAQLPDQLPDRRLRRHGAEAVESTQAQRVPDRTRAEHEAGRHHRHPRACVPAAGAAQPGPVSGRGRADGDCRTRPAGPVRRSAGAGGDGEPAVRVSAHRRRAHRPGEHGDRHRPQQGGVDGPDHGAAGR